MPLSTRVVEVIADLGSRITPRYRYGSGCIVRGRTVLTAAHVVVGAQTVQVRGPDKVLLQARVDPRFVGSESGPDLALVDIDEPGIDLPALELAVVDRDSPEAEPVERCHAIGYPWFMERPLPTGARDTADAYGHIPVLSSLASGLLTLQVSSSPRPLPRGRATLGESEWSGMSGAPVVREGCLLGVVSEHAAREGPSAITAMPVSCLEADPAHPAWGSGVDNAADWWARLGVSSLAALRRVPARQVFVGRFARLRDKWLDPAPVFDEVQVERFTGREWLLEPVDRFLAAHDHGYVIVQADAGLGKTALAAWLAWSRG